MMNDPKRTKKNSKFQIDSKIWKIQVKRFKGRDQRSKILEQR